MLLTPVWRWFPGWVQVEAEGGFPARLLNESAVGGLQLWGVRRRGEQMRFFCFAGDYRRLHSPARRAFVRLRVRQKHGLPFWLHRYRRRRGLAVALAVYGALLLWLFPRIWVVDVVGAEGALAERVATVAAEYGVRLGASMDALEIKDLEISGLDRIPELVWMTVNPSGSVARIEVQKRQPTPQVLDLSKPSDLVAVRDGRILSMTVFGGDRMVRVGEAVSAGTVLVSGKRETLLGPQLYRSYGQVIGETRRRFTVTVPLVYTRQRPAGETVVRPTLFFMGLEIPLYARTSLAEESCVCVERAHFLTAGRLRLPLGITGRYYTPLTGERAVRTPEQAAQLAAKRLENQRRAVLGEEAVCAEVSRREWTTERDYVLCVEYRCEENIAVERPYA